MHTGIRQPNYILVNMFAIIAGEDTRATTPTNPHLSPRYEERNLECSDSSPFSVTATGCGELKRADQSAQENAAASCLTPKPSPIPRACAITQGDEKGRSGGFTPPSCVEIVGQMAG